MIGKGARGPEVVGPMRRTGAVYLRPSAARRGHCACVQSAELVCWEDLAARRCAACACGICR
jgi:tartrate dehydratase beta subunit/fumarate hydratase class I family protein